MSVVVWTVLVWLNPECRNSFTSI